MLKLSGLVSVTADPGWSGPSSAWRRTVADTALRWWGDTDRIAPRDTAAPTAELIIDLHGRCNSSPGRIWRVVDVAGRPALSPFFALEHCQRATGIVSLFLIESRDGGKRWMTRSSVHLSASQSYRGLLRGIGAAVPALVAAGLNAAPQPTEWRPAPQRSRWAARLTYPVLFLANRCRDYVRSEVWAIGSLDCRPGDLLAGGIVSPTAWMQVPEHEGYIADPFPWPGRSDVILCERYHHRTGLGSLQSLTVEGSRIVAAEDIQLGLDSHFSYPFTFEEHGRVVCLPEMGAARRQVMYELEAGRAPRTICVVAENRAMADATIFKHDGRYFIAYTDADIGFHDNLCLLWADRLEGPWAPHRGNPVKIDVRSSRCGGTPFRVAEQLVRPAQDCASTYGAALVLNRVIECTPDSYREQPVARLVPDPQGDFPAGLHTLSFTSEMVLVDGKKFVFDLNVILQRIRRRLMPSRSATVSESAPQC